MNDSEHHEMNELYEAICRVDNIEDAKNFLDDLLSTQELESLSARVRAAKMLMNGMTYVEVTRETNISSATLARINKCIKNGKGYNKILK